MSDKNIKKIIIKNADLPDLLVKEQGWLVKYRVVSEDKNRISHWSPIKLIKPEYTFVSGVIVHSKLQGVSGFIWDPVIIKKGDNVVRSSKEFDIWVRFDRGDSGDWVYQQRIEATSFSLLHPTTYKINGVTQASAPNKVSIEIFLKGTPISRSSTFLKVYSLLNESL